MKTTIMIFILGAFVVIGTQIFTDKAYSPKGEIAYTSSIKINSLKAQ